MNNNSYVKPNFFQVLTVWMITVLIWGGYRMFFANPEWIEEIILKPIVFVLPVVIYISTQH